MRQSRLTAEAADTGWLDQDETPKKPKICVNYQGTQNEFVDELATNIRPKLTADELDITYRYQSPDRQPGQEGILAVSDQHTGDYVFEVPLSEDVFNRFLECTHQYGKFAATPVYQFELWAEGTRLTSMSKSTLLVYTVGRESASNTSILPDGLEP